ncbi:MAG: S9 family peptidase, partial [Oceanicaulis sp.]
TLPFGAGGLAWSPDGSSIAFTMFTPSPGPQVDIGLPQKPPGAEWADPAIVDENTRYEFDGVGEIPDGAAQIYVISADGGAPRALTSVASGSISGLEWSPDGREIYFSWGAREEDAFDFRSSDIYAVRMTGGAPRQVTDFPGPETSPDISPDGRRLAFLGEEAREESHIDTNLYVMDLDGGEPERLLSDLDRGIDQIAWASDRALFVRYDDRGRTVLAEAGLNGGIEVITEAIGGTTFGRPYTSGSFSASDNGRWAATLASATDLADVGAGTRRGGRELTDLNADSLRQRDLSDIERFTWQSSADGQEIEGWIAYPPDFDPSQTWPMILEIHGGPHTAYGPQFSGEVQLFAAAGYVVFYTNPRGSTSYGEAFANEIDKNYPGEDVDDLLSGVDALVARGFVDPERLFVTGGSGGGVLTAQLIGVAPEKFAAAAVGKPVINWTSFALAADIGPGIYRYWFGVTPWEDPDQYWRRSPLSLVGEVETPTLVFVGAEDRRTPVFEAEQYYNALQIRGVESRLVRIPGAYHGIADSRPTRLLQKVGHILAWFEDHDPAAED